MDMILGCGSCMHPKMLMFYVSACATGYFESHENFFYFLGSVPGTFHQEMSQTALVLVEG